MASSQDLALKQIFRIWWPLAASWVLMALEGPLLSLVVARLAHPEIHLAAYGGAVYPLGMLIDAPIVMLLAASTALSKNWQAYRKIRAFMHVTGAVLTGIHMLIAFTPLYHLVVGGVLGIPDEVLGPARIGLMIMLPKTWSIAYRRFNQGMLIRFGHSPSVGIGTAIRLGSSGLVLLIGYWIGTVPGIVVATAATAAGVLSEAFYIHWRIRPVLRKQVRNAPEDEPLTLAAFLRFYIPLSLTSLILLGVRPILTATLSRMPMAIESLALWSVVGGITFLLRSVSLASNEVIIAKIGERNAPRQLHRFALMLAGGTTALLLLITTTGLSRLWFGTITGLNESLTQLACTGLWFALPLPALSALQSWYQSVILHSKKTRGISEAVAIYVVVIAAVLMAGVTWGRTTGLYIGLLAMSVAEAARAGWLAWRSRGLRRMLFNPQPASPRVGRAE